MGWGDNTFGQIDVSPALAPVSSVACGNYQSLALTPVLGRLWASRLSLGLVIAWTGPGTLQWAAAPGGPYADLIGQDASYTNLDLTAPAEYFRLRR